MQSREKFVESKESFARAQRKFNGVAGFLKSPKTELRERMRGSIWSVDSGGFPVLKQTPILNN